MLRRASRSSLKNGCGPPTCVTLKGASLAGYSLLLHWVNEAISAFLVLQERRVLPVPGLVGVPAPGHREPHRARRHLQGEGAVDVHIHAGVVLVARAVAHAVKDRAPGRPE